MGLNLCFSREKLCATIESTELGHKKGLGNRVWPNVSVCGPVKWWSAVWWGDLIIYTLVGVSASRNK